MSANGLEPLQDHGDRQHGEVINRTFLKASGDPPDALESIDRLFNHRSFPEFLPDRGSKRRPTARHPTGGGQAADDAEAFRAAATSLRRETLVRLTLPASAIGQGL